MSESFIGMNDFLWFIGVVESRQDPKKAGRLQVRILGHHTPNKNDLPTADLMWASVMLPLTAGGISGIGDSPTFTPEGTHVMGYFRDGDSRQDPVVMGALPGIVEELGNTDVGFYDPNAITDNISKYPKRLGSDVNQLARNDSDDPHESLTTRASVSGIPTAGFVGVTFLSSTIEAIPNDSWDEPKYSHNTVYPYNHVMETESGHITEYDDTPDYERIHLRHRAGSSIEISNTPDVNPGTRIDTTVGDHYSITEKNSQELIQFHKDETIGGHYKLFINQQGVPNQHFTIQVGAGSNVNLQIDQGTLNVLAVDGINFQTGGDFNLLCSNLNTTVLGNKTETILGAYEELVSGTNTKTGTPLKLN